MKTKPAKKPTKKSGKTVKKASAETQTMKAAKKPVVVAPAPKAKKPVVVAPAPKAKKALDMVAVNKVRAITVITAAKVGDIIHMVLEPKEGGDKRRVKLAVAEKTAIFGGAQLKSAKGLLILATPGMPVALVQQKEGTYRVLSASVESAIV